MLLYCGFRRGLFDRETLRDAMASTQRLVRLVAALLGAEAGMPESKPELLAQLSSVIVAAQKILPFVRNIYFGLGNALQHVPMTEPEREEVLRVFCDAYRTKQAPPYMCTGVLLSLAFPGPIPGGMDELSARQREVLLEAGKLAWSRSGEIFTTSWTASAFEARGLKRLTLDVLGLTEWLTSRHPQVLQHY